MSTLHRIREFARIAALGLGVLAASATLACDDSTGKQASIALFADLGHMTVVAPRDATVASLGSLTVTAPRLSATYGSFADLGSMTVTASRADLRVADLGAMTVQASRIKPIAVASRASERAFN